MEICLEYLTEPNSLITEQMLSGIANLHDIVLVLFSLDPSLRPLTVMSSSSDRHVYYLLDEVSKEKNEMAVSNLKEIFSAELQKRLPRLFYSPITPKHFAEALITFSQNTKDSIKDLIAISIADKLYAGFYSSLILSYYYNVGIKSVNLPKNTEYCFEYFERAITLAEKALDFNLSIAKRMLGYFDQRRFEVKDFFYRILLVENQRINFDEYDLEALNSYFQPNLNRLAKEIAGLNEYSSGYVQQKTKLESYYSKIKSTFINLKIKAYAKYIKLYATRDQHSTNCLVACYNLFQKATTDLIDSSIDTNLLFNELIAAGKFHYRLKNYKMATLFYCILSLFDRSPESAIRLGDMAAQGFLIQPENPEIDSEKRPDFEQAVVYHKKALDKAIELCDINALAIIINTYINYEEFLPTETRINLKTIISLAFAKIKEIASKSQQYISLRIMIIDLLRIILERSVGREHIDQLKKIYLNITLDNAYLSFFKAVAEITDDKDFLVGAYCEMIEHSQSLFMLPASETAICVHRISDLVNLLRAIQRHDLHHDNSSLTKKFFQNLDRFIAAYIKLEIRCEHPDFGKFRSVYNSIQCDYFPDRSRELTYWETYYSFEKALRARETPNIDRKHIFFKMFLIINSAITNIENSSKYSREHLELLELVNHPLAYFKIAELSSLHLGALVRDGYSLPSFLTDIGENIIRSMTLKIVEDTVGGYVELGFKFISQLTENYRFETLASSFMRFYLLFALLIKDPQYFSKNSVALFNKEFDPKLVVSVLKLLKEPSLTFSNEVKYHLLSQVVKIDQLEPTLKAEAVKVLASLPTMQEQASSALIPLPSASLPCSVIEGNENPSNSLNVLQQRYQKTQTQLAEKESQLVTVTAALARANMEIERLQRTRTVFTELSNTRNSFVGNEDIDEFKENPSQGCGN